MLSKGFHDEGFDLWPLCEIDDRMRQMYEAWSGERHEYASIDECIHRAEGSAYMLSARPRILIGGPPCQAHSKTRSIHPPKFADLTPQVNAMIDLLKPDVFLFENVVPLALDVPHVTTKCDAMHWPLVPGIHQSRPRWFTHSPALQAPEPLCEGTVDSLVAYPVVMGRVYGPKRGAILQGWPEFAGLAFPCAWLQLALANGVPVPLARAWAQKIKELVESMKQKGAARAC